MDQDWENKHPRIPSPLVQQLLKLKVWFVERFHIRDSQLMLVWATLIGVLVPVSWLVGRARSFPVAQRRHLVACGAAAGIASAYNAPIAGSFFVAEIILGTVAVESLGPLILAAVVATFTGQLLHGGGPIYKSPGFALHSYWEILLLSLMGLISGLLAPVYLRFLRITETLFSKFTLPPPAKLALGGAIVGFLAIISPDVCGNGQGLLNTLFRLK